MRAAVFGGQGNVRPGAGTKWADRPEWTLVEEVSAATHLDVAGLLVHADTADLVPTKAAQAAAFTFGILAHAVARSEGIWFDRYFGHSLGELVAVVAAGALSVTDGARLVAERGQAMATAIDRNPGTMVAVIGLDIAAVEQAIDGIGAAWVANDNAPGQVVLGGSHEALAAASTACRDEGAKGILRPAVAGAFHTPLMGPATDPFGEAVARVDFDVAAVPVISNIDARPRRDGFGPSLVDQLTGRVLFRQSILTLSREGVDEWWELGSGAANLAGMVKRTLSTSTGVVASVAAPEDLRTAAGMRA